MTLVQAYAALGLQPGATKEQVKDAYRKAALKAHPDKGGSAAAMTLLNLAKDRIERGAGGQDDQPEYAHVQSQRDFSSQWSRVWDDIRKAAGAAGSRPRQAARDENREFNRKWHEEYRRVSTAARDKAKRDADDVDSKRRVNEQTARPKYPGEGSRIPGPPPGHVDGGPPSTYANDAYAYTSAAPSTQNPYFDVDVFDEFFKAAGIPKRTAYVYFDEAFDDDELNSKADRAVRMWRDTPKERRWSERHASRIQRLINDLICGMKDPLPMVPKIDRSFQALRFDPREPGDALSQILKNAHRVVQAEFVRRIRAGEGHLVGIAMPEEQGRTASLDTVWYAGLPRLEVKVKSSHRLVPDLEEAIVALNTICRILNLTSASVTLHELNLIAHALEVQGAADDRNDHGRTSR